MAQLEDAGVATVVVCTTAFLQAATEQWEALGFPASSVVTVAHPLGSMPLERVLAEADLAVDPVVERLSRMGGTTRADSTLVEGGEADRAAT